MNSLTFFISIFISFITSGLCQNKAIREVSFNLDNGRFYTKQIGDKGPTFIVGTKYQQTVPKTNSTTVMTCILKSSNDFRLIYMTTIRMQTNPAGETVNLDETLFDKYFGVVGKEVWSCNTDERIGMLRIFIELVGREDISKIHYRDGVQITSKPLLGERRTAHIEEIKYFDQKNSKFCKFDGLIVLRESSIPETDRIPGIIKTFKEERREMNGDTFTEKVYTQGSLQNPSHATIDVDSSIHISCISFPSTEYASESITANCAKIYGIHSYKFSNRPELNITDNSKQTSFTLTKENYLDYITPIKDELWSCDDDVGFKFLRYVQEFLGRKKVGEVRYSQDWTDLRSVKIFDGKTIKVKAIYYSDYNPPHQLIAYRGKIRLKSPENRQIRVMTRYNGKAGDEMKEIDYVLDPTDYVYRSFTGPKGLNVRVGTPWTKSVGDQSDVAKCHLLPKQADYLPYYGTKFRLLLQADKKEFMKAIPRSKQHKYWQIIKQEIWMCEKTGEGGFKFLRIVNELKGLKALFQVEYYDNIQLYSRVLVDGETMSVNLVEINYMDHNSFQSIKYDGKLLLQSPTEPTKDFIDCINCDGLAIRKTENEIVIKLERKKPTFAINKVPILSTNRYYWRKDLTKPLSFILGFRAAEYKKISIDGNLAQCAVTSQTSYTFDFPILLYDTMEAKFNKLTKIQIEEFGEAKVNNVWECKNNKEFVFFRIEHSFLFKKPCELIFYYTETNFFLRSDGNLAVNQIYLVDASGQPVNYGGSVKLVDEFVYEDELLRSGTIILNDGAYLDSEATLKHSDGRPSVYNLDFARYHKIKLKEKGISVEIGQKWTSDSITESVQCFEQKNFPKNDFEINYRAECTQTGGNDNVESTICFDTYFDLLGWEVWDCTTNNKIVFRRIVSYFELKPEESQSELLQLKEIRYHDGVFIGTGRYAHGVEGWTFKEIKYVSYDNSREIYKYEGKLTLKTNGIVVRPINNVFGTDTKSCLFNVATRSISYLLNQDKVVYRTIVKPSGIVVMIDSRFKKTASYSQLLCDKQSTTNSKYGMQILFAYGGTGTLFYNFRNAPYRGEFYSTSSMSWNCFELTNGKVSDVKLIRVVNRLKVDMTDMSAVIHYDGVTVIKSESVIEEIKFIDPSDGSITKFDGSIIFWGMDEPENKIDSPKKNREVEYILGKQLIHHRKIKDGLIFMEFGSQWQRVFADSHHNIKCDSTSDVKWHETYLPDVYTRKLVNRFWIRKKMSTTELDAAFRFLTKNATSCENSQYGSIIRVVNKILVEAKHDIAEILHTDGVTIWRNKTDGSITLREVKYLDPKTNEILKFDGTVEYIQQIKIDKFEEGTSVEDNSALLPHKYNKAVLQHEKWHKDLIKWQKDNLGSEPLENIVFTPGNKHLTRIQQFVGLSIEIGQTWTKKIGSVNDTFKCKVDTTKYDKNVFIPMITVDLNPDKIRLDEGTIDEYFDMKEPVVYKCSKGTESFLKVVTELQGKSGVRQVLHSDGVRVMSQLIDSSTMTARIIEHKYLDPSDFSVVRFDGKLEKE